MALAYTVVPRSSARVQAATLGDQTPSRSRPRSRVLCQSNTTLSVGGCPTNLGAAGTLDLAAASSLARCASCSLACAFAFACCARSWSAASLGVGAGLKTAGAGLDTKSLDGGALYGGFAGLLDLSAAPSGWAPWSGSGREAAALEPPAAALASASLLAACSLAH